MHVGMKLLILLRASKIKSVKNEYPPLLRNIAPSFAKPDGDVLLTATQHLLKRIGLQGYSFLDKICITKDPVISIVLRPCALTQVHEVVVSSCYDVVDSGENC